MVFTGYRRSLWLLLEISTSTARPVRRATSAPSWIWSHAREIDRAPPHTSTIGYGALPGWL